MSRISMKRVLVAAASGVVCGSTVWLIQKYLTHDRPDVILVGAAYAIGLYLGRETGDES